MSDDFVIKSEAAVKTTLSMVIEPVIDKSCTEFPLEAYSQIIIALIDSHNNNYSNEELGSIQKPNSKCESTLLIRWL